MWIYFSSKDRHTKVTKMKNLALQWNFDVWYFLLPLGVESVVCSSWQSCLNLAMAAELGCGGSPPGLCCFWSLVPPCASEKEFGILFLTGKSRLDWPTYILFARILKLQILPGLCYVVLYVQIYNSHSCASRFCWEQRTEGISKISRTQEPWPKYPISPHATVLGTLLTASLPEEKRLLWKRFISSQQLFWPFLSLVILFLVYWCLIVITSCTSK